MKVCQPFFSGHDEFGAPVSTHANGAEHVLSDQSLQSFMKGCWRTQFGLADGLANREWCALEPIQHRYLKQCFLVRIKVFDSKRRFTNRSSLEEVQVCQNR